jgi:hypothetical protein
MRHTTTAWDALAAPIGTNPEHYNSKETSLRLTSVRDFGTDGCRKSGQPLRTSVRIVSILAFTHSLLFLVIWLLICASAGAAEDPKTEFSAGLRQSTYNPVRQRDPFFKVTNAVREVKSLPGTVAGLQLDGILYQHTDPSAIVNGQLVTLNKIVTLNIGTEEYQIRAIEITREHVVLEANGRTVELNLSSKNPVGPSQP